MQIQVRPKGSLDQLSQLEIERLHASAKSDLYQLFRSCSLAVLAAGIECDDSERLFSLYKDFQIKVLRQERGVILELTNPPLEALVDGKLMRSIQEHLSAVMRDILYINERFESLSHISLTNEKHITNAVFEIVRNAKAIKTGSSTNMVCCWGGHSINPVEYQYTREVGFELGLRDLNICTGCGPGAMEGPMKGAAIAHAKQRNKDGRFLGLTEPSIIAAEPPNQIVNELVILPDIEKRLEAFVRISHGIVIFPGGVGTAEELLYLLGILLNEHNLNEPMPVILTGPASSSSYFEEIHQFIGATLGPKAQNRYRIIIDDPVEVARHIKQQSAIVKMNRQQTGDSFAFNWSLKIEPEFQLPFEPSHEAMANLALQPSEDISALAANLRKAFSGIVAGNVKSSGVAAIAKHGPFQLNGDADMMRRMDNLLAAFVSQGRMKLQGEYHPCYEINHP
ncbi:nucleotide 5'-monophosphate nucleosidase PpnN [Ferrimonas lipolytica]|uniref:AMP nucleosidase n=1 Tax=Ferrimonas lipolytica TaxID=2724191 RepID=A0A6H1UDY5_9GAMM|nr:nucleotide 5'-monophosphate nucleosidase PpnN [Ferrimonas lipolytica]QIZ77038.1 LOG family protein [Ferrimonas lipolytica]